MEGIESSEFVPDLTVNEVTAFSSGQTSAAFLFVNVKRWFWCDNRKQFPAILKKIKCYCENDNRLKGEKGENR